MKRFSRIALVSLLVWAVQIMTQPVAAQTFDAVTQFSNTDNSDTSTWSYRYLYATTRTGVYGLFTLNSVTPGIWNPDTRTWWLGVIGQGPTIGVNNSGGTVSASFGMSWPPGTILMHPPEYGYVVVSWLAPKAGTADVSSFHFRDMHAACGNGINWYVEKYSVLGEDTTVAQGTFPNGGDSGLLNVPGGVTVNQGDRINFVVEPNGDYTCDSTEFTATIKYVTPAYTGL